MPVTTDELYTLSSDFRATTRAGGETVLMDVAGGTFFALDSVGSIVWDLLERGSSLRDVTFGVSDEFPDVDRSQIRADVEAFINELGSIGAVHREGSHSDA